MRYFSDAASAARGLGLDLLLSRQVDARAFERHERLSELAIDAPIASQLLHRIERVIGPMTSGRALWFTAPWGSLAHLPWAVGVAERLAARDVRVVLCAGEERAVNFEARGEPQGPPEWLGSRLHALRAGGPWGLRATDIEGVHWLSRRDEPPARLATSTSGCLVWVETLPESLDGPYRAAAGLDAVVLVASFRDHGVFELEQSTAALRGAGHRLAGLVALGPETSASTPVEPAVEEEITPSGSSLARAMERRGETERIVPARAPEPPPTVTAARARAAQPPRTAPAPAPPPAPEPIPPPTATPTRPRAAGSEPPSAPPPPTPATVPLLSRWDERTRQEERGRQGAALIAALVLFALAIVLAWPRLRPAPRRLDTADSSATLAPPKPTVPDVPTGMLNPVVADTMTEPPPEEDASTAPGPSLPRWLEERQQDDAPALEDAPAESAMTPGRIRPRLDTGRVLGGADTTRSDSPVAVPREAPPLELERGAEGPPFVVHLSSFRLAAEADSEVAHLAERGIEARALLVEVPRRGPWYRVLVGEFATFAQAESAAVALSRRHRFPLTHIVGQGGRGQPEPADAQAPGRAR